MPHPPLYLSPPAVLLPATRLTNEQVIARVREKGFGVNLGSFREDVGGVGVAVRNSRGEPIAGLSLCIPVFRLVALDIDKLGERLLRAARDAELVLNAESESQAEKLKDVR